MLRSLVGSEMCIRDRTQRPLGPKHQRHDPNDINNKQISRFSSLSDVPARNLLRTDDIIGGGVKSSRRCVNKGYDSMQVRDINSDGIFVSTRKGGNPLEPTYDYDPQTNQSWKVLGNSPAGFRKLSDNADLRLRTRDIAGCVPDDIGSSTRNMATRQALRTDDIALAQANTVRQAMRTKRCTNPLEPVYTPLQAKSDTMDPCAPLATMRTSRSDQEKPAQLETGSTATTVGSRHCHDAVNPNERTTLLTQQLRDKVDQKGGSMSHHFVKFDANHDGTINHSEFRQGIEQGLGLPLSTPDVQLLLQDVDQNNSGQIDYIEFANKMKARDETTYQSLGRLGNKSDFRIKTPLPEHDEMTQDERIDRNLEVKLHYAVQQRCDDLVAEFRKFDLDRDSMLSRSELKRGLERIGLQFTQDEFKRLMSRMDSDDTGFVDYSEFTRHLQSAEMLQKQPPSSEQVPKPDKKASFQQQAPHMLSTAEKKDRELMLGIREKANQRSSSMRKLLSRFDLDGNGKLDYPEFRRGLERGLNMRLSHSEFNRVVQMFDQDGSGQIDYLEFSEQMKGQDFGKEELYMKSSNPQGPGCHGPPTPATRSRKGTPSSARLVRAREREERQTAIDQVQGLPDALPQLPATSKPRPTDVASS
eukprot:TRINITY_DN4047_c0_g1_i2.p1 TRINITY_DN4047_c0_g1~~TRINITY_DN4047_c0_g1_i2.p1  ORF type:complete len:684 (+),score=119.94 TRINITY_DN4047_c0_g1_i2:127-2052(+)